MVAMKAADRDEATAHQAALQLALGNLQELARAVSAAEVALLAEGLRKMALEAQLQGPRPLWAAVARAAEPAPGPEPTAVPPRPERPPPGLALEVREGMGRALVASRDFAPGEALFAELPLASISGCMLGEGGEAKGPIMVELAADASKAHNVCLNMDVIVESFQDYSQEDLDKLSGLESHIGHSDYVAGELADHIAYRAVALGVLRDQSRRDELLRFLRLVCVNAHTVPRIKGVMLFYWLSMFAHSCNPNATYSTHTSTTTDGSMIATPRAVRRIKAGEVISMSYLSLEMLIASTPVRREVLSIQKGFVCACERCSGPDDVRALACPACDGFCVCRPTGESGGKGAGDQASLPDWHCQMCKGAFALSSALLETEEKLVKFVLTFNLGDEEQNVHSVLEVVSQDLGREGAAQCGHFLRPWLLLTLLRLLLRHAAAGTNRSQSGLSGRYAARAAAVLWLLKAWLDEHLPSCMFLFAVECAVPTLKALLAAEPQRNTEAASVAAAVELPLAAAMGPDHVDVQLLGAAKREVAGCNQARLVTCDACGASLSDCRHLPDGRGRGAAGPAAAQWCGRCGLAPFCSEACEALGRRQGGTHAALCVTSAGLA